jgi:hypothetical protein
MVGVSNLIDDDDVTNGFALKLTMNDAGGSLIANDYLVLELPAVAYSVADASIDIVAEFDGKDAEVI